MKTSVLFISVALLSLSIGGFWTSRTRKNSQLQCHNYLRQLDGAASCYCLEQRVSPASVLSMATLGPYLKIGTKCPAGKSDYPAFSVLNGPTCPNGHPYLQGLPRPLRASSESKLASVYLYHGFTNLIDWAETNSAGLLSPGTGH